MLCNTFPKTVIFTGLKWCGYGHQLTRSILGDQQHLGEAVNQYHAHLPTSVNIFKCCNKVALYLLFNCLCDDVKRYITQGNCFKCIIIYYLYASG